MQIVELPIHILVDLIHSGKLDPREVFNFFCNNIFKFNNNLNAFITVDCDITHHDFNSQSQMAGIPIAIKDNIITKGMRTTCGSKMLENFIPPYDATAVSRLKNAGATIIGKTNMDEFAMGSSTEYSIFGASINPFNNECVAGGSSGGSAVAVASCMAAVALGSDTGGSVRQPAAFSGIVGFKPSYGRISRYGLVAFASSLDQIGFLTRDVLDSVLLYSIIAGPDKFDATMISEDPQPVDLNLWRDKKPKVAILEQSFDDSVDKIIRDRIEEILAKSPSKIDRISLPELEYCVPIYYIIAPAECSANLARYDGVRYGFRAEDIGTIEDMYIKTRSLGFGDEVKRRIMIGTFVLSAGYSEKYFSQAQRARMYISSKFKRIFDKYDFIISPTTPTQPFKLGEKIDDPVAMYLSDFFTVPANLIGAPAISIPINLDKELPFGIHIMASPQEDASLLAYAAEIEDLISMVIK